MIGLQLERALHILKTEGTEVAGIKSTAPPKPMADRQDLRIVRINTDQEGHASLVVASFPTFTDRDNLPYSLPIWG